MKRTLILLLAACGSTAEPATPSQPPAGLVVTSRGIPVKGATISFQLPSDVPPTWVGQTNSQGRFEPPRDIREPHAVVVAADGHRLLYRPPATLTPNSFYLTLSPPKVTDLEIQVTLVDRAKKPIAGGQVQVVPMNEEAAEKYILTTNTGGQARVYAERFSYILSAFGDSRRSIWEPIVQAAPGAVVIRAFREDRMAAEPNESTLASLKRTVHVEKPGVIPPAISKKLGKARVVGLGESTHGSHEFFELKRQLLQDLILNHSLKVVAIEANFAEALAVDRILQTGEGDLGAALAGMHFWIWDTKEVLETLEWIREHNRGLDPRQRVRFFGIDAQFVHVSVPMLLEKLRATAPELATEAATALAELNNQTSSGVLRKLPAERRKSILGFLDALLARLSGEGEEHAVLKQLIETIGQALRYSTGDFITRADLRERALADNVLWLTELFPDSNVAIWSHNAHVGRTRTRYVLPMGARIALTLGESYQSVGLVFNRGTFRVRDLNNPKAGVVAMTVKPAKPGFLESGLSSLGDRLFLDVDSVVPGSPGYHWLEARPMREIGHTFSDDLEHSLYHVAEAYNVIGFIEATSPSTPTPTGVRPPKP